MTDNAFGLTPRQLYWSEVIARTAEMKAQHAQRVEEMNRQAEQAVLESNRRWANLMQSLESAALIGIAIDHEPAFPAIDPSCRTCGNDEIGAEWPCETFENLEEFVREQRGQTTDLAGA